MLTTAPDHTMPGNRGGGPAPRTGSDDRGCENHKGTYILVVVKTEQKQGDGRILRDLAPMTGPDGCWGHPGAALVTTGPLHRVPHVPSVPETQCHRSGIAAPFPDCRVQSLPWLFLPAPSAPRLCPGPTAFSPRQRRTLSFLAALIAPGPETGPERSHDTEPVCSLLVRHVQLGIPQDLKFT